MKKLLIVLFTLLLLVGCKKEEPIPEPTFGTFEYTSIEELRENTDYEFEFNYEDPTSFIKEVNEDGTSYVRIDYADGFVIASKDIDLLSLVKEKYPDVEYSMAEETTLFQLDKYNFNAYTRLDIHYLIGKAIVSSTEVTDRFNEKFEIEVFYTKSTGEKYKSMLTFQDGAYKSDTETVKFVEETADEITFEITLENQTKNVSFEKSNFPFLSSYENEFDYSIFIQFIVADVEEAVVEPEITAEEETSEETQENEETELEVVS